MTNVPINGLASTLLAPGSEEDTLGWYYEEWGEDTLAGLLLKLDLTDPTRSPIRSPILGYYLLPAVEQIQLYKISNDVEPEQLDQSDD